MTTHTPTSLQQLNAQLQTLAIDDLVTILQSQLQAVASQAVVAALVADNLRNRGYSFDPALERLVDLFKRLTLGNTNKFDQLVSARSLDLPAMIESLSKPYEKPEAVKAEPVVKVPQPKDKITNLFTDRHLH